MPEPNGGEAENYRPDDVTASMEPLFFLEEFQGLEAEGREGGVTAADTDHEKLAAGGTHHEASRRIGQGCEEANGKRTADIHKEGAPREGFTELSGDEARKPESGERSQGAAKTYP